MIVTKKKKNMDTLSSTSSPPAQKHVPNVKTNVSSKLTCLAHVALQYLVLDLHDRSDDKLTAEDVTEQQRKAKNKSVSNESVVKTTTEPQEVCPSMVPYTPDQQVDNKKADHNVTEEQHKENSSMSEQQETCLPLVQDTTDQLADKIYFHLRSRGPVQARNIHSRIFDD